MLESTETLTKREAFKFSSQILLLITKRGFKGCINNAELYPAFTKYIFNFCKMTEKMI